METVSSVSPAWNATPCADCISGVQTGATMGCGPRRRTVPCGRPRTDQARPWRAFRMTDDKHPPAGRHTQHEKALLLVGVIGVRQQNRQRVAEYG